MARALNWEIVKTKYDEIAKRFLASYDVHKIYPDKTTCTVPHSYLNLLNPYPYLNKFCSDSRAQILARAGAKCKHDAYLN